MQGMARRQQIDLLGPYIPYSLALKQCLCIDFGFLGNTLLLLDNHKAGATPVRRHTLNLIASLPQIFTRKHAYLVD